MHLVELRCSKSCSSLSKATTVIISSAHIASRTNNYNINYDLDFIDFRISLVVNPSIKNGVTQYFWQNSVHVVGKPWGNSELGYIPLCKPKFNIQLFNQIPFPFILIILF